MKNEILPAVAVVIFNRANEVLLQKRNDTNKWCIICGHVEFGESVEEAILREILEETDTPAEIVRLIGVYSSPSYLTYSNGNKRTHYITTCFEARLTRDIAAGFSNQETRALKYFPVHELPPDMDRIHPQWLEDALDKTARVFVR
jgi:ADP-ribose pyrophosphatase YjhB (NUDIX family)